jgi:hypothetical protein
MDAAKGEGAQTEGQERGRLNHFPEQSAAAAFQALRPRTLAVQDLELGFDPAAELLLPSGAGRRQGLKQDGIGLRGQVGMIFLLQPEAQIPKSGEKDFPTRLLSKAFQ